MALQAVALEILLICPMRLTNLTNLRMDSHLLRIGVDAKRVTHFVVSEAEVKNGVALEWPIPPESARLIETYIRRFRPTLADPANPYLFPGQGLAPRSVGTMAAAINGPIAGWLGCKVNPHLLRHFAAWRHLKRHPGEYETVRRILNHKSIETTTRFYIGFEAEVAAMRFDEGVLKERHETRALAKTVLEGRRPPRQPRRKPRKPEEKQ